jgi:hypothetical protein
MPIVKTQPVMDSSFKKLFGLYRVTSTDTIFMDNVRATCIIRDNTDTAFRVIGVREGNFFTFKLSSKGEISAEKYFILESNDFCITTTRLFLDVKDIKRDGTNGFVIVGDFGITSNCLFFRCIVVMKIDNDGNITSVKYIQRTDRDLYGESVIRLGNGDFIFAGYSYSPVLKYRIYLYSLDASLSSTIWSKDFQINDNERNKGMCISNSLSGNYAVSGQTSLSQDQPYQSFYFEIDSTGTFLNYAGIYNAGRTNTINKIIKDKNDGLTLFGGIRPKGSLGDPFFIQINRNGSLYTSARYTFKNNTLGSSQDHETGESFIQVLDHTYLLTGSSNTKSQEGTFHSYYSWADTNFNIKKSYLYGYKCTDSQNELCSVSGGYDIDCLSDSLKTAIMVGSIRSYGHLVKPGPDPYLREESDTAYFRCSQLLSGYVNDYIQVTVDNPMVQDSSVYMKPENIDNSEITIIAGFCNLCNKECTPQTGRPIPLNHPGGCNCSKLLKKND